MLRCTLRWRSITSVRPANVFGSPRWASSKPPSSSPQATDPKSPIKRDLSSSTHRKPFFDSVTRYMIYAWIFLTSGHIFITHFYECDAAEGISMLPTIASFGDWVIISKYYRRGRGIKVGDVVSFRHPARVDERAVKRVLAMEGDFVLATTPEKSDSMIQVPQGHCWVVGDNMLHSRDSRMFGPLPLALISGKVIAKLDGPILLPKLTWMEGIKPADVEDDID